jgi:uncharacterized membrane protein
LYAVFDAITAGLAVVFLSAYFNSLIVFVVAVVVIALINLASCTWVDREWETFASGPGKRVEKRLDKMRKSKTMRHPVEWITRGSAGWYALAAALINAITVTALARIIGGKPVGQRRVQLAAIAYAVFFAGIFTLIGIGLGDLIRAL